LVVSGFFDIPEHLLQPDLVGASVTSGLVPKL
jgi:hypothetical protein